MSANTLFDKVWDSHTISSLGDGFSLLQVDRNFIHDLSGARALQALAEQGRAVMHPDLTFACPDHTTSTALDASHSGERYAKCVDPLRDLAHKQGVRFFEIGAHGFGIIHVIGPELGLTLPGSLIVCGDSHTSTHGGLGALAWGIGASEVAHVLATGAIIQQKPKRLRVRFDGQLQTGVTAKDLILYLIGRDGVAAGNGYAVEYAGPVVRSFSIEQRMTLCNLSIEMGAKIGMVAPDATTYAYLAGREYAPKDANWDAALAHWQSLPSDAAATFDLERSVDACQIRPQVTWGTSPEQVIAIDGHIPDPSAQPDPEKRRAYAAALDYMGLTAGAGLQGTKIDQVFIGSCTNGRLSDLREAAGVLQGQKVAAHVRAWVVPGSVDVKRAAEAEGLDRLFTEAGFEWRNPGCSLCVGANGEVVAAGKRCMSTSNRNFVGRQGTDSRTHLASPIMAAAAAIRGEITDVRAMMEA
ncbi:MAG: 3-isopropylmalate dehydratase large subunit [Rhodospirillales bacterium]|nr:3-isopropylmalate dehydratase large subunit [Rhodospirillales bacterium]